MQYLMVATYLAVILAIAVRLRQQGEARWLFWTIFVFIFPPVAFLAWISRPNVPTGVQEERT